MERVNTRERESNMMRSQRYHEPLSMFDDLPPIPIPDNNESSTEAVKSNLRWRVAQAHQPEMIEAYLHDGYEPFSAKVVHMPYAHSTRYHEYRTIWIFRKFCKD